MVDTAKLREKISNKNMSVADVAAAMNIDKATFYRRIASPESFTIGEVLRLSEILNLTHAESTAIFLETQSHDMRFC